MCLAIYLYFILPQAIKTESRIFALLIWILIMQNRSVIMIMLISKIKIPYTVEHQEKKILRTNRTMRKILILGKSTSKLQSANH
jgi:hypothetical protein